MSQLCDVLNHSNYQTQGWKDHNVGLFEMTRTALGVMRNLEKQTLQLHSFFAFKPTVVFIY